MRDSEAAAVAAVRGRRPMLSRLRIGPKLLLAPALVLALLVVSSCAAYWAMLRQNQSLETIVQVRAARIREAGELVTEAQAAHARSYQLLTWISASVSAPRIATLEADIHRRHAALARRFVQLAARSVAGSAERRLLEQAEAAHALHVKAVREVIDLAGGDQSVAASAMVKAEHAFEREALRLAALAAHEQQQSEAAARRAAAEFGLIRMLMPALVALSILLSLWITLAVRRALLREVRGIGESALELASGNLTVRTRDYGRDEISDTSRTLDASIRTLNGTLKEILASARLIDSASRQIAMGNSQLSECAGRRATSFEPTRATMEQLSAMVSKNAGYASAARRLVAGMLSLPGAGAHEGDMQGVLRQLSDILSQIGDASAEQAIGISDVSCAIVQMDHITQENTSLVEAAAAAAARLQAQAASLSQAVAAFKLDEGAGPVEAGRPRLWLASRRE